MRRRRAEWIASIGLLSLLLGPLSWGGMAELGARRTVNLGPGTEAFDDPAAGDGTVTLRVNDRPFTRGTSPGQTVNAILELLEGDVNASGLPVTATHDAGSDQITVVGVGGSEVRQLSLSNTDSGLEFVSVSRNSTEINDFVSFAVNGVPSSGEVRVAINAPTGCDVTVGTAGLSIVQVAEVLVQRLNLAGCDATLRGGNQIRVTRVYSLPTGSKSLLEYTPEDLELLPFVTANEILWEDSDDGILSIGVDSRVLSFTVRGTGLTAESIPTLSQWGLGALLLMLAAAGLGRLRRARRNEG